MYDPTVEVKPLNEPPIFTIIRRAIEALGAPSISSYVYRRQVLELLYKAVPFDAYCFTSVDPHTLLSTGAVTEEGIEAIHHRLFENEYTETDFNKFSTLVAEDRPAATLRDAVGGQPESSTRLHMILRPAGFHDEMRAVLVEERVCWGHLTLFRQNNQPLFQCYETEFVASLLPVMSGVLRQCCLNQLEDEIGDSQFEQGILVLSEQYDPLWSNKAADVYMIALRKEENLSSLKLPRPVQAVCTLVKRGFAGKPNRSPQVCLRLLGGPYLTIRASELQDKSGAKRIAVSFEKAGINELLPMITGAFQLSTREKDVLDLVLRGHSTKAIAQTLYISAYTVQDHLKSIFAKTGLTTRRELIWLFMSRFDLAAAEES